MDPPADPPTVPQRLIPQYSMATGLKVVTGCCILFSLTAWHPVLGWMLSTPIVGAWWSYSAVRAGRRKLAYYLAAWPMGVAVFVVGFLPFPALFPEVRERLFLWLMVMSLAWMITVAILRKRIRRSAVASVMEGILSVYVTAVTCTLLTFVCGTIASLASTKHGSFGFAMLLGLVPDLLPDLLFGIFWATILMPWAGPFGMCFCTILRRVDPVVTETDPIDKAVLRLVENWKFDSDGPLEATQVAKRLDVHTQTAVELLEMLCRQEILEKTDSDSYRPRGELIGDLTNRSSGSPAAGLTKPASNNTTVS